MSARPLPLRERLRASASRPLLLGPSALEVFGGGASALVEALRRSADAVIGVQRRVVEAGADLVLAPTAQTTAPALHQSGQAYRAAALTAAAVDLTRDAAFAARTPGSVSIVGEILASSNARARVEAITHVERLATSAIDGVLVCGDDPEGLLDVVRAASAHGLPALMQIELARGDDALAPLERAGVLGVLAGIDAAAPVVLLVGANELDVACEAIERLHALHPRLPLGARLKIGGDTGAAQLEAANAWGALASFGLAILGVRGPSALQALPALADLMTAERASLPGPPTVRQP